MSNEATVLFRVEQALQTRGFAYAGRADDGWPAFSGTIAANKSNHSARICVDLTGQNLPRITVKIPANAPAVLPHIGANGSVCYAAHGTLVLDIFDIAGQVLGCLDRAAHVLDTSLSGGMQQDLEDEFFAFWNGDFCFLDIEPNSTAPLTTMLSERFRCAFVSGDLPKTRIKLNALPFAGDAETIEVDGFQVSTLAKPKPTQYDWPPTTVAKLLAWQQLLDPKSRRRIEQNLLHFAKRGKETALCVIKSPLIQYAFWVDFKNDKTLSPSKRLTNARPHFLASRVHPMTALRIDDHYISHRNSPKSPSLAGKQVAIAGCGAIGGFLAELLVKNGAGLDGGRLTLIDHDILMPHNVGRHRLGLNHSLESKATALKGELTASAPTSNIRDLPVRIQEAELGALDLFIDATGEESLSASLVQRFGEAAVPTLTVWIEGPGIAVRSLLRDSADAACVRCLCAAHGEQLFPVVTGAMPEDLAGNGCESLYVPFPATVSIQAACLAADMVTDWLKGDESPRLRTRIVAKGFKEGAEDQNPPVREACPACSS
nr:E2/UBC family protein [uncultured Albidiferax sp.]